MNLNHTHRPRQILPITLSLIGLIVIACSSAIDEPAELAPTVVPTQSGSNLIFAAPTSTPAPVLHFDTEFTDPFEILNPLNENRVVDLDEYLRNTEPDSIAPVYSPEYVTPDEAPLKSDELVMGVEINGESRAFPVGLMRNREMVNDVIGGVPVLVSWCPICFTGLVHDRRIDGEVITFDNEGVLFMNAMTWWDHKTASVWSQPWGMAILGELKGVQLTLIPYELTTWAAWFEDHPATLVLTDERGFAYGPQEVTDAFVIGVAIQDQARGFYYKSVEEVGVHNDQLGQFPIVVVVNSETREIDILLRNGLGTPADDDVDVPDILTFARSDSGVITDLETGSSWDVERGIALDGPLRGTPIQKVPYQSSFDWAWNDFFPDAGLWGDRKR